MVSGRSVRLDTIIWPGGDLSVAAVSTRARTVFRVVTALSPPFVMESELDEDGQCLRGKLKLFLTLFRLFICLVQTLGADFKPFPVNGLS